MLTDFLLAALHHLLFFGLILMLAVQSTVLRGPLDASALQRLGRIDAAYGLTAVLLLVAGTLRIVFGLKGWDFYAHNPWFHAKLGAFLLAALLSAVPTVHILRWRRAHRRDPAVLPGPADAARLRPWIGIQYALLAVILVCPAGMARHGGL